MENDGRSRIYIHSGGYGFKIIYPSQGSTDENVNLRADYSVIARSTHEAKPGRKLGKTIKNEWGVKPTKENEGVFCLERDGRRTESAYAKLVEELETISGRHDLTIIVG